MVQPRAESISVIMAAYNDVGRIGDALASIVGQTSPPAEIVVADDGSDDGTEQFVSDFAARQARRVHILYIRLASKPGVIVARNEAVAAARGDWIANCDSDDMWAPTKLERQIEFIRGFHGDKRIVLLGTYGYNMNDARHVISPAIMGPTTEDEFDALRRDGGIPFVIHSSALFSREDFSAVGGYPFDYGSQEDLALFCLMAERGIVMNLPKPLTYYRKRPGSFQIARFWDQQNNLRRLAGNERRRASGQLPISADEFAAQLASASAWRRFTYRKQLCGTYYYRSGAANIVNRRRVRGGLELALGSMMDGSRVRAGLGKAVRARLAAKR
jgi:glycosyltransferase involved in cell wall biosynthesis